MKKSNSYIGGPEWFTKLFPYGCGGGFGPGHPDRHGRPLTRLEMVVFTFHFGHPRMNDDESILAAVPVLTSAKLARVKAGLQEKYEEWQRAWFALEQGIKILRVSRLFPER